MTEVILIRLNTIRKNPNAGRTTERLITGQDTTFEYHDKELPEWLKDKAIIINSNFNSETGTVLECALNDPSVVDLIIDKRDRKLKKLHTKFNSVNVHFPPERQYNFEYNKTRVTCGNCKQKVKPKDIVYTDQDDYAPEPICPKCGEIGHFDYTWETIEEALKRMGTYPKKGKAGMKLNKSDGKKEKNTVIFPATQITSRNFDKK